MAQMNEAYDLDLFKPREPRLVALEDNKRVAAVKKKRSLRHRVMTVTVYLVIAVLAMAMVGYLITGNVRLTEMNKQIIDCEKELGILQSERVRLESELAAKTSAEQLNRYAQENGMAQADSNQIYYVTSDGTDVVTLPDQDPGLISRLWQAVCGFFS